MKKSLAIISLIAGVLVWNAFRGTAQDKSIAHMSQRYEYAIVKWDGPDRLFYNMPSKFEWAHIEKDGLSIPREAQNEEFCLAYAANKMAADGWEPVNLDSRRMVFRRAK